MSGYRITDPAALECAKEASGEIRLDIEAAFSQGLPNTPMAGSRISVISGNFIIARPVGIVDGTDFMHTGLVRKVDSESIAHSLLNNKIVLMSPLGFSPTGQAFNLAYEDVATATAIALRADKLIFLTEYNGITDTDGELIKDFSLRQLEDHINGLTLADADLKVLLQNAIRAIKSGVSRVHLLPMIVMALS